ATDEKWQIRARPGNVAPPCPVTAIGKQGRPGPNQGAQKKLGTISFESLSSPRAGSLHGTGTFFGAPSARSRGAQRGSVWTISSAPRAAAARTAGCRHGG